MTFSINVTIAQVKVFSAVCSNLAAGWMATILITTNLNILTVNLLLAILSWKLAIKAEGILE